MLQYWAENKKKAGAVRLLFCVRKEGCIMKKKKSLLGWLWDYAVITFACALYALAFNCFFHANHFAMGGFTGISQILNHFFPQLPIGTAVLLMNIPLLVMGVRKQGWRILVNTLYAVAVSSLMIDGMNLIYTFPGSDPLLGCVYGGVLMGGATGLMLQKGATTGGTELAARLLKYKLRHVSIGKLCLYIDVVVICLYGLTFRSMNNALYGLIAMFILTRALDMVVYGTASAKMALIISDKSDEVRQALLDSDLGVTVLSGRGGYTGVQKNVVLCVFRQQQIVTLKAAATAIDPNAFIIVCEAHEVLGYRFGEYTPDSL